MTDARIEAAWSHTIQHQGGMSFAQYQEKSPDAAGEFSKAIMAAIEVADAADWRPVRINPQSTKWVLIVSQQGGKVHHAIAKWDYAMHCWRNPDLELMYSPIYFTHWRPLPAPPHAP